MADKVDEIATTLLMLARISEIGNICAELQLMSANLREDRKIASIGLITGMKLINQELQNNLCEDD